MSSSAAIPDVEVGESTPLLDKQQQDDLPLQEMKAESLKEKAVAGVAGVGFLSSLLSMLLEAGQHPIVLVSGILGTLLAPAAAFQQHKLTQVEALQQTNERFEQELSELDLENQRLKGSVREMEESVLNLQAMEETLETLQSLQGESVTALEKQLQESQEILSAMQDNYKADLLQNLISVMLAVDDDKDMMLSDADIDDLIHNLEGIHGVQLKEDRLRETVIAQGRSLAAVMEVARNLLSDDIPPEENIFSYIEDEQKKN